MLHLPRRDKGGKILSQEKSRENIELCLNISIFDNISEIEFTLE